MSDAINAQIAREFYASHLYLAMRAYFESQDLVGFARWMQLQSDEERLHAMKLYDYLLDRGGMVRLGALAEPQAAYASPLAAFEAALVHEQLVSRAIHELYELARNERDTATQVMLQWFVSEQVEEESNATRIINRLRRVGGDATGILMLDQELGGRQVETAEA
jgi:ferritin